MTVIHKKVWRAYFEKILSGEKQFEVRLADFEVSPGDTLVLEEWDETIGAYTGRKIQVTVTYILKTKDLAFWSATDVARHGLQIIQFKVKE